MMKYIFAAIIVGLGVLFLSDANAQTATGNVCETPSMTMAKIENLAEQNGFEYTLDDYKDVKAQAAREYIQTQVPNPDSVYQFDNMLLVKSDVGQAAYVAIFKDGCMVFESQMPMDEYYALKRYVDGV